MREKIKRSLAILGFGGSRREILESELLAWIIRNSDDAIVGETLEGTIVSWNAGAERLYGYSTAEMIGAAVTGLVPPERSVEINKIRNRIRRRERISQFDTERLTKSGKRVRIALALFPVELANDGSLGALSIARELTGRKGPEAEIANAGGGILGQLAQTTIHNLRNCLHVISGHEEMLSLSVGADPALCWHAAEIRSSVERAAELVSRLQTMA
jgi:PAS domain S-box-containing protein